MTRLLRCTCMELYIKGDNMTATERFLLQCLKDHLHGLETKITPDIDWKELETLAKNHDVSGMVYHQTRHSELSKSLQSMYAASLYYYIGRNQCCQKVTARFHAAGIPYAFVKGQILAGLYPHPELRTMGDIDLLIREDDKPQIHKIMTELGYTRISDAPQRDWDYQNKLIEFELHPLLIYPDEQVEKKEYFGFFNDFWSYVDEEGQLKKEFHLLYLLVHLRKHLLNHGAGFRQFMDIGVFTERYRQELDWEWFGQQLDCLGLRRFAIVSYAFVERWFEIATPLNQMQLDEDFYEKSTEKIFRNGIFGFQADDDAEALVSYDVAQNGFSKGRAKNVLRIIFPSYVVMKSMKRYAFLEKYPVLLPAAWIYRWIVVVLEGKFRNRKAHDRHKIQRRVDMIKEWGM